MPKSNIVYDKTSSVESDKQSLSLKCRYITIADFNLDHLDSLLDIARSQYSWYAYIIHQPESSESAPHLHLLCYSSSNLLLSSHIERFRDIIPGNFVRFVRSGRGMSRYLTHMDNPEKIQYNVSDVISSNRDKYLSLINDSIHADSLDLWTDYKRLRCGALTPEDFIDKYRSELASMPMYQRFSMYTKIFDTCGYRFVSSASLSFESDKAHPPDSLKGITSPDGREVKVKYHKRKDNYDSKTN